MAGIFIMPSESKKQAHFMSAVKHNKAFAEKVGVPQSVGREFHEADIKVGKWEHRKYEGHNK